MPRARHSAGDIVPGFIAMPPFRSSMRLARLRFHNVRVAHQPRRSTPLLVPRGPVVRMFATVVACIFAALSITPDYVDGAAPTVRTLSVRGLRVGGPTTMIIDGSDLLPNPRIVLTQPIASQSVKPTSSATRLEIDVVLDASAEPGLQSLYLATDSGLSERQLISVDNLTQLPFAANVDTLPAALHGTLGAGTIKTKFPGRAGQQLVCEVESQRLGSKLRPVLHLYDGAGTHLAWSLPLATLRGDTRITAKLPRDGDYTLTLNDLQYNAPGPNHFRLKIGTWQFADFAFPPAVQRGSSATVRLIGATSPIGGADAAGNANNAGVASQPGAMSLISLPITATPEAIAVPALPADAIQRATFSGFLPAIQVTDSPEVVEAARDSATATQDLVGFPVAVSGWLSVVGEEDRYRVKVVPESKLRFEIFAARLGTAIDSVLEVRREAGAVLATNDDIAGTTDSAIDFTVPKDVDTLVLAVKDSLGRAGEGQIYRLSATAAPASGSPTGNAATGNAATGGAATGSAATGGAGPLNPPDFRLVAELDRWNIAAGGRGVVRVRVDRRGYFGPIRVDLGALPTNLQPEGLEIPAEASGKLIVLNAKGEGIGQSLTTIRGVAMGVPGEPAKLATIESDGIASAAAPPVANTPPAPLMAAPWLATRFAWAATVAAAPGFDADWQPPADAVVVLGGKLSAPIVCRRPPGWDGPVRLVVLTSQNPPLVNGKDDPNRTLRAESNAPVELAADPKATAAWDAKLAADKVVAEAQAAVDKAATGADDKAKAEAMKKLEEAKIKQTAAIEAANAAAAAAKNDLSLPLVVPVDLTGPSIEIAFRAELLSRDKQRVLQTTCTPVRTLPIANPLKVSYGGPTPLQAKLDAKTGVTVKVAGKIERRFGLTGDVSVSVAGLPSGIAVPKVAVKADQTDFELELKFPANQAPGMISGLTLFATGKMTPQSTLEVRSADVAVLLELLASGS